MTDRAAVAAECYRIARDIAHRHAEMLKHVEPGQSFTVRREELEFLVGTVLDLTAEPSS